MHEINYFNLIDVDSSRFTPKPGAILRRINDIMIPVRKSDGGIGCVGIAPSVSYIGITKS